MGNEGMGEGGRLGSSVVSGELVSDSGGEGYLI